MILTQKRLKMLISWKIKYRIMDYWSDVYNDKIIFYGVGVDNRLYKKIIR